MVDMTDTKPSDVDRLAERLEAIAKFLVNFEEESQDVRLAATTLAAQQARIEAAMDVLSGLSSYLGAGLGDEATTPEQFNERIRWGIEQLGAVHRARAAAIVEECSKRPKTTWGEVKCAILDDTAALKEPTT